ncbi:hypothetical protein [Nocardia sp. CA-119907]|uniref:hypothetical protein n=1 Tax=Nocardia sp. CA-119907 TaxID=3239973 RepID=UPI003D98B163
MHSKIEKDLRPTRTRRAGLRPTRLAGLIGPVNLCSTYPWKRQNTSASGAATSSLEELYNELIAKPKLLGHDPDRDRLHTLREELDQLDYRIRVEVPAGQRYELNLLSRQANASLTGADSRAQIARNVAHAEREREAHDAAYPTILSPRSPLADRAPNALIQSERNWREGIERERRGHELDRVDATLSVPGQVVVHTVDERASRAPDASRCRMTVRQPLDSRCRSLTCGSGRRLG